MANLQEIIGLTKSQFNMLIEAGDEGITLNGQSIVYSDDVLYLIQPDATDDVSIASVEQTATSTADSGVNTLTVTLTNGRTSTFNVRNGGKGSPGTSVTVQSTVPSDVDEGSNIVTFSDGKTLTIKNGRKGSQGVGVSSVSKTNTNGKVDTYTITLTDGKTQTFTVTNGQDGSPGKTPVKGTDYFTASDIAEVATQAANHTTVSNKINSGISGHNTATDSHNDIRALITNLQTQLNTLANSTDEDLDQLSEIVAYIKANKGLIDGITTSKVNVADIVDNLTTAITNRPLSANQGVELKKLIADLRKYVDDEFAKLIPITRYW